MQNLSFWADCVEKVARDCPILQSKALISFGRECLSADLCGGGDYWLELGQFSEVLGGCCEGKLVLNAAWPP